MKPQRGGLLRSEVSEVWGEGRIVANCVISGFNPERMELLGWLVEKGEGKLAIVSF